MEPLVLALGGRLVRLASDRLDPEGRDVFHELAQEPAPRGVQRDPVIGEQPLRHPMGGHRLVEDRDRSLGGLT